MLVVVIGFAGIGPADGSFEKAHCSIPGSQVSEETGLDWERFTSRGNFLES